MLNVRERREAAAKREAAELIDVFGPEHTARLLDVHLTTVKRWASGEVTPQGPVLLALRFITGRWGEENKDWSQWRIAGNFLHAPGGERFVPGDLYSLPLYRRLADTYRRQVEALKAKIATLGTGAANDAVDEAPALVSEERIDFTIGRERRRA